MDVVGYRCRDFQPDEPARYNRPPALSGTTSGRVDAGPARILLVEDEVFIAYNLSSILSSAGYEVVGMAVAADEAVTMARELAPDLALMDIRLLGSRDGIDAALQIWQELEIRSLFLSAYDDDDIRRRAALAQPIAFLTKPVSPERLLTAIKTFLDT